MKRLIIAVMAGLFLGVLSLASCKKEGNNGNNDNFDRKALLTNYADNYIIPAYLDIVQQLTNLKARTDEFIAAPDEAALIALKATWNASYKTWQKVDLLEFGPAEGISLRMYMNIYPVSISKINNNIVSGFYDLEAFGNTDAQGFPALDYLLNGLDTTNAGTVIYYTTDAVSGARKLYLQAVVNKMLEKAQAVNTAWSTYRATFIDNTGTDVNGSLSKMVNGFVLFYERYLRAGKIGLPVGAMTGVSKSELTEAYYAPELSKDLAVMALTAVNHFYDGKSYDGQTDGIGMKDYLAVIGTKDDDGKLIADLISDEMNNAISSVQSLTTTIKDGVVNNRTSILSIYEQLQELVPLFKVDMVSAFGISITYVDNDGD